MTEMPQAHSAAERQMKTALRKGGWTATVTD